LRDDLDHVSLMSANKICIIQAYEAQTVPDWIARCLNSVREWAAVHRHDYHFSPEFWCHAPEWFRERCGPEFGPVTDVARVYMMKEQFERGAECVVWIDADVLVFDPQNLRIPTQADFFGIKEITILTFPDGSARSSPEGVNGAVLGARRGSALFDVYLKSIECVAHDYPDKVLPRTVAGPQLLTRLASTNHMECLTTVGLFTPAILNEIALGQTRLPALFSRSFGYRVAAANLCHFFRGILPEGSTAQYDAMMLKAIDELVNTRGEVVNGHLDVTV
jgi:hypothetical protein